MSWLQRLYKTYNYCLTKDEFINPPSTGNEKEDPPLLCPVSHTSQQVHILVHLDMQGNFAGAELLPPKKQIIIPATIDSAGRTGKNPPPHPLIDKIRYCAKDYKGVKKNFSAPFLEQLGAWCNSVHSHPKAVAVYKYLIKGTLVQDLLNTGILFSDASGNLLTEAPETNEGIFKLLTSKKVNDRTSYDQGDALVCWRIVGSDDFEPNAWKDKSLQQAWIDYDASTMERKAFCMVSGQESFLAGQHPRNIRRPGDQAKLISGNDKSGFTFRGRFEETLEASSVSYEVSHKAHNALRWLIARQGYRHGDMAVVAWAESGASLPGPCENIFLREDIDFSVNDPDPANSSAPEIETEPDHMPDLGQLFSRRLAKALAGYKEKLLPTDVIAILGLNSASPGRLAVTFYQEQTCDDYLANIQAWQEDFAWILPCTCSDESGSKKKNITKYIPCAPTPEEIAKAAYGLNVDDKLLRSTVERLLPSISDLRRPLPQDIMQSCVRRAANRVSMEAWEYNRVLAVACALYKGYYARHPQPEKRRKYTMTLDPNRTTRDYLYGRLLAVAHWAEQKTRDKDESPRPTNAERFMTKFAVAPYTTWPFITKKLEPYLHKLQSNVETIGWYNKAQWAFQEIHNAFAPDDYASNKPLEGEFLLGYHCQISALYTGKPKKTDEQDKSTEE